MTDEKPESVLENKVEAAAGGIKTSHSAAGILQHGKTHVKNCFNSIKNHKKLIAATAAIYLAISLVMFWPVTLHITSTVAGYGGDPYQTLWGMWIVEHSIFVTHQSIWSTNLVFWPIGANLVYQTFFPIASVLVTPFTAISLPFAYNLLFFFGFVFSGLTMFLLARYIVKNNYAAFIAGLIFAFSSFHISQSYGHLNWTNIEWVPLALYFYLKVIREENSKYFNAVMLSVSVILAMFFGDVEMGIMLVLVMLLIFIYHLFWKSKRQLVLSKGFYASVAIFVLLTALLGSWAFLPMFHALSTSGLSAVNYQNGAGTEKIWSSDLLAFFLPNYYNGIFNGIAQSYINVFHGDMGETGAYIGYVVIALVIIGLAKKFKGNKLEMGMWLLLAVLAFLFSLGPVIQINGVSTGVPGIYGIINSIPILNVLREPGRFNLIFTLAFAILAAFGSKFVYEKLEAKYAGSRLLKRNVMCAFAVISVIFLIESNGMPLSSGFANQITTNATQIPKLYYELGSIPYNFSVLALPSLLNGYSHDPELYPAMNEYFMTASDKPMIGGYTTRENSSQIVSMLDIPLTEQATGLEYSQNINSYASPVSENYTNETLLTLYNYNTAYVTLDKNAYNNASLYILAEYLFNTFGNPVYNDNSTIAFATSNAINNSIYRSFVAYPNLNEWSPEVLQAPNGTLVSVWVPSKGGSVVVFAPYPNSTSKVPISTLLASGNQYSVKTRISFDALSLDAYDNYLNIGTVVGTGGSLKEIGTVTVGPKPAAYSVNATLVAGPFGNGVYFYQNNTVNSTVAVYNITLSGN